MTNPARRYSNTEIELVEAFRRGDQKTIDSIVQNEGRTGAAAATQPPEPQFPRLVTGGDFVCRPADERVCDNVQAALPPISSMGQSDRDYDSKPITSGGHTEKQCDDLIGLIRSDGQGRPQPDGTYVVRLPRAPQRIKYTIDQSIQAPRYGDVASNRIGAPHVWSKLTIKKWVAAFDNHGDMQDDAAVSGLFDFCEEFRPDVRIGGGDHWDFRALRSSASKYEQRDDDEADVRLGFEFLEKLRPTHLLEGNHDKRLRDEVDRGRLGPLNTYCKSLIDRRVDLCNRFGATWYPYHSHTGVLRFNDLAFVHGYAHSAAACANHAIAYGDVVLGHGHAIDAYSVRRHPRAHIGMMVGCLCKRDMDYASKNLGSLRWGNGFGFGYFVGDSHVKYQATIVDGRVILPGAFN